MDDQQHQRTTSSWRGQRRRNPGVGRRDECARADEGGQTASLPLPVGIKLLWRSKGREDPPPAGGRKGGARNRRRKTGTLPDECRIVDRVKIASNYQQANDLALEILRSGAKVVGFDVEWTAKRRMSDPHWRASLVQVYVPSADEAQGLERLVEIASCSDGIFRPPGYGRSRDCGRSRLPQGRFYVFRMRMCFHVVVDGASRWEALPPPLKQFLECKDVLKVGVGIVGDSCEMAAYGASMEGLVDAQWLAGRAGLPLSLVGLSAHFGVPLGNKKAVSEVIRTVDWDVSFRLWKIQYAAWDAYLSFAVTARLADLWAPSPPLLEPIEGEVVVEGSHEVSWQREVRVL